MHGLRPVRCELRSLPLTKQSRRLAFEESRDITGQGGR